MRAMIKLVIGLLLVISPINAWAQGTAITISALEGINPTSLPAGYQVSVTGYYASGDSPQRTYSLKTSACSPLAGDGGAQIQSNTAGFCWVLAPQTIYDPRLWGAYGDMNTAVATAVGACTGGTATVSGFPAGTFTSADAGKLVVITDYVGGGSANGQSYAGSIANAPSGTSITVSPCPTFTSSIGQHVFWGHDDADALNATIAFLGTLRSGDATAALPQLNGGGLNYGACSAPVNINAPLDMENIALSALSATNMPVTTAGLIETTGFAGAYTASNRVDLYLNYLLVDGRERQYALGPSTDFLVARQRLVENEIDHCPSDGDLCRHGGWRLSRQCPECVHGNRRHTAARSGDP